YALFFSLRSVDYPLPHSFPTRRSSDLDVAHEPRGGDDVTGVESFGVVLEPARPHLVEGTGLAGEDLEDFLDALGIHQGTHTHFVGEIYGHGNRHLVLVCQEGEVLLLLAAQG